MQVKCVLAYQEIEQRGIKQGVLRQLIRVLRRRFGEIPQELEARLEGESVEQLETLMDSAIAVNSLEEFITTLSA
ncbi:MAG: DUF4351 domain-containing protein [Nostoc sp. SerVER01]|nr:DUF4351 domain-containing protein [Nostoc sp. SerVER01]MDZ8074246.1 DUF4351 domain-containing protein [Nostoc sp. DedQUE01]MDZ8080172.1 DUF4351 domain-containing protein [Nostoc sp. DcaGUA01]